MRSGHALWLSKVKYEEDALANGQAVNDNQGLGAAVFCLLPSEHIVSCLSAKIERIQAEISDLENELLQRFVSKSHLRLSAASVSAEQEKTQLISDANRIDHVHVTPLLNTLMALRDTYDYYKKKRIWCVRESSVSGMISLEFLAYDFDKHIWRAKAQRFALVNDVWIKVSRDLSAVEGQVLVNADNINQHIGSLMVLLEKKGFGRDCMVEPQADERLCKKSSHEAVEVMSAVQPIK